MSWLLRVLLLLAVSIPATGAMAIEPDVRDRVVPAAVQVAFDVTWIEDGVREPVPYPVGSGTIVSPDGLVLTSFDVVDWSAASRRVRELEALIREESPRVSLEHDAERFVLLASEGELPPRPTYYAEFAALDPELGLAVLQIVSTVDGSPLPAGYSLPALSLGNSDALRPGDAVHILSFPASGGSLASTSGVVSGFNYTDDPNHPIWINTDTVLSGGSGGGTAVNDAGELIGVVDKGIEFDCRPGDLDGDGTLTKADVGCIPTGAYIGRFRPISFALPLIEKANVGDVVAIVGPPKSVPPSFNHGSTFDYPGIIDPVNEEDVRANIRDGALVIAIRRPGASATWGAPEPTNGISFGYRLTLGDISGEGEVVIILSAENENTSWAFMIDPTNSTWRLVRQDPDGSLFTAVQVRDYGSLIDGELRTVEVQVTNGEPALLINREDVAAASGIDMPSMPGSLEASFGAWISNLNSGATEEPFVVNVLELRGYAR